MATKDALSKEFREPEARRDYANLFLDSSIALQLKALRLQRGWSQHELALKAGMKQSRISAMEQTHYSSWSISTLRRLAEAFDLALVVSFESFGTLLRNVTSFDRRSLERPSFDEDPDFDGDKEETSPQDSKHVPAFGTVTAIADYKKNKFQQQHGIKVASVSKDRVVVVEQRLEEKYG